jgi:CsoR family transcriptional regulator, copper-sensing transcriptional repressor
VGTVQLVKGNALPPLDNAAMVVPSIDAQFRGPSMSSASDLRWSFRTAIPTQPIGREQSAFEFEGSAQLSGGIIRPIRMARGTYDVYTGSVSWLSAEEAPRMIMGQVEDNGQMSLLWPGASIWGARMSNYGLVPFQRQAE